MSQAEVFLSYLGEQCVLTLFHMGGGGAADSTRLQIVSFITSVRDAAKPRNLVTFPKI